MSLHETVIISTPFGDLDAIVTSGEHVCLRTPDNKPLECRGRKCNVVIHLNLVDGEWRLDNPVSITELGDNFPKNAPPGVSATITTAILNAWVVRLKIDADLLERAVRRHLRSQIEQHQAKIASLCQELERENEILKELQRERLGITLNGLPD